MHEVVIIGAGLAGLTCARALQSGGVDCVVVEAGDAPGGRVRTDEVEGFRLDRGFQVLLTAYPAARAALDYAALRLGEFEPGARVATPEGPARVSDPWRRPGRFWETLLAPVGTMGDKVRVGALRLAATRGMAADGWPSGNVAGGGEIRSTAEELERRGFSPLMRERFLRPWLSGIFLERELSTPAAMLFFVYGMFARGAAALPAGGMQRIPEQLAAGLRPGTLRLGETARAVGVGQVTLVSGETLRAREVVVAVEAGAEAALGLDGGGNEVAWRGVTCVQWAAPRSPLGGEPVLWLNGTGRGQVNTVVVPSDVAAGYAPAGQTLVSTTVLGEPGLGGAEANGALTGVLREEMKGYFGPEVGDWRPLAVQRILRALPVLARPGRGYAPERSPVGVWRCGDCVASASIQGAMASGAAVAAAILKRG
ncbi:MAG: FAD-dependent oxidoreductase [Verrucomicrobia bacterium]|nr:FAD-dependent oxidoreductase [Verrucomicrobiota bacterium]